jgi:hypothetical protein
MMSRQCFRPRIQDVWDLILHREKDAPEIRCQHVIPFPRAIFVQRLLDGDAGIVEGNIKAAITSCDLVDECFDLSFDTNIRADVSRLPPFDRICCSTSRPRFSRRPQNPTFPPSAAKAIAAARPIPDVAPVTMTTLFSKRRFAGAEEATGIVALPQAVTAPAAAAAANPNMALRLIRELSFFMKPPMSSTRWSDELTNQIPDRLEHERRAPDAERVLGFIAAGVPGIHCGKRSGVGSDQRRNGKHRPAAGSLGGKRRDQRM